MADTDRVRETETGRYAERDDEGMGASLPLPSPKPTSPEKDLHRPLKKRLPTAPNPREAGSDTLPPKPAALVSRAPVTPQALLHGSKLRVQGPGPIPSGKTR